MAPRYYSLDVDFLISRPAITRGDWQELYTSGCRFPFVIFIFDSGHPDSPFGGFVPTWDTGGRKEYLMGVTTTSSVTINSAFLQEIKDVNQQLWDLLDEVRQLCKTELRNQWDCYRLSSRFELLRDQLATHFSLEEAYGYFDDPVSVAPRLSERVEKLRAEHGTLYVRLADLVEFVQRLNTRRRLPYGISRVDLEFGGFYQDLLRHEDDECCLILEAYDDDVGVGD